MTARDFIAKHVRARSRPRTVVREGIEELNRRLNGEERWHPPTHFPDQRGLIADLFDTDETVWMLFLDAGRYDLFDRLVWDYFDGDLQRCWNGGVTYTGDWAVRNLSGDYPDRGLFSWLPLRELQAVDYDGRAHFTTAPDIRDDLGVRQRLAALGYAEAKGSEGDTSKPSDVNRAVLNHMDSLNGGVVRYYKPHPPFDGMEELTSQSTKGIRTKAALDDGRITYEELTDAYIETYHTGFWYAAQLVPELPGRVVITSDHGTCLTCGQLYHGRNLENHDHLCVVPWFEVDQCLK